MKLILNFIQRSGHIPIVFCVLLTIAITTSAQGTSFTYQGKLDESGQPANGMYDIQFALFDAQTNGTQIGQNIINASVQVSQGIFTVNLNFGSTAFSGTARFIEIAVRPQGSQNGYTTLGPRQQISSAPYSIRSLSASSADIAADANKLGGKDPTQYAANNDPRLSDMRNPLPGAPVYIQNTTSQQTAANFNISGTGTANSFNAGLQYNIGNSRVLSIAGTNNLFAGVAAGSANTSGTNNVFVGPSAGLNNSSGFSNSFFGSQAGKVNEASDNSFFGDHAGFANTGGTGNSFFGASSGLSNSTGNDNTYIGQYSGLANLAGTANTAIGATSAYENTSGNQNVYIGASAGRHNKTGSANTFIGLASGQSNVSGNANTLLGSGADVNSSGLTNASAIGFGAIVSKSDSMVLGGITGVNGGQDTNIGIGTTAPKTRLHIFEDNGNILFGNGGCNAGFAGIGFASTLTCSNYSILGEGTNTILNRPTGGSISFRENNAQQMSINAGGTVSINTLGSAGATQLCRNASNQISTCSSSLRYKKNINPFLPGLNVVSRLKPITFDWKDGGMHDLGFGAEDIAAIEPLLVSRNQEGVVEGVKYDRISAVLVNAVKEQQVLIARLQKQVEILTRNRVRHKQSQSARKLGWRNHR